MTDIEREALALVNEVLRERGYEVSSVCEHLRNRPFVLDRFILPKPVDLLVEALNEAGDTNPLSDDAFANAVRAALAARGLQITEIDNG